MRPSPWFSLAALLVVAATAGAQDWKGRARIDGQVTGEDGAPLAGAGVNVDRLSGGAGPRVRSGHDGRWAVDGIAAGSWTIVVEAPGYRPARVGIHLPGESSWLAPVEVRLEKARAAPPPLEAAAPAPPERQAPPAAPAAPAALADVRRALESGRVEQARALAELVEWNQEDAAGGLFEIGAAFLNAGAPIEAVAFLDVVLDASPGHVEAYYRRALALLALGRESEARHDFETIVELRPEGPRATKARVALDALPPAATGE